MFMCILALINLNYMETKGSKMEGFIVGGEYAKIEMFPYSAHLSIRCAFESTFLEYTTCGASLISNDVSLSAAHCFEGCTELQTIVSVGHVNKNDGIKRTVEKYTIHPKFDQSYFRNDIALTKWKTPYIFNAKISRVNLKPNPYYGTGYVAGWGYVTDRGLIVSTNILKYTKQPYIEREICKKILSIESLPLGNICAGYVNGSSYLAQGDSGSALVVDNYQIGIVSYKYPSVSKSVTIFTDVPYYYNWIMTNMPNI